MLKKYGILTIIFVLILAVISVGVFYKKTKDANDKFKADEVKIYEESKIAQAEYEKALKIVEEEKKRIEEENKLPKSTIASIPIFMYHRIADDTSDEPYPENMVKIDTLRKQLEYIKNNGYEPIYISDLSKIHKYTKPVALTFDDGWEDFYTNAFPLIKEYKVKVSLYVMSNFFGLKSYCSLEQLKEIEESDLVDIQAHTITHPYLAKQTETRITEEVVGIKTALKEKLDIDSNVFCYPYGSRNDTVVKIVKENYKYALDMDGGVYNTNKHDSYKIPRIYANRSMPLNTYISYLKKSSVKVEW